MRNWFLQKKRALARLSALTLVVLLLFSLAQEAQAGLGDFIVGGIKRLGIEILMVPLYLAGWLSWLGGVLLNESIQYTIIDLSKNLSKITGINIAWSVLRDLANISFIFILLYTAIQTILGQATGKMKSAILGVVVAAVLINFSLFFTRVAIDTSNILAITFYTPIENCVSGLPEKDRGMATCLMSTLGLSSTFGGGGDLLKKTEDFSTAAIIAVGGAIFLTITFFIFTAIAIMLLIRYVNFIYLLIISPIGIAGSVIPGLSRQASAWREKLIGECVFAPAYMLATWVVLIVLQGGQTAVDLGSPGTNAQKFSSLFEVAAGGGASNLGTVITFVVVIGLTLGSLLVAKSFANQSGSAGEKLISGGLGLGLNMAGFGGRLVGGGLSRRLAESNRLKAAENTEAAPGAGRMERIRAAATRMGARTATSAGRFGAKSSWDVRGGLALGEKFGAPKVTDLTGTAGGKGGFEQMRTDYREFLSKPGTKSARERNERVRKATQSQYIDASIESASDTDAQMALNRMTPKEVENLGANKLTSPVIARNMSPGQYEAIIKTENLDETQKHSVTRARFADIYGAVTGGAGAATVGNKIRQLTDKELENFDINILRNPDFIGQLKYSQIEAIQKSPRFIQADKDHIKAERKTITENQLLGRAGATTIPITKVNMKELANLDIGIIDDPAIVVQYTPTILKKLGLEINDPAKGAAIRAAINRDPAMVTLATWLETPEGDAAI